MNMIKQIVNVMIEMVKKSDYNCSPCHYYKPKKVMK